MAKKIQNKYLWKKILTVYYNKKHFFHFFIIVLCNAHVIKAVAILIFNNSKIVALSSFYFIIDFFTISLFFHNCVYKRKNKIDCI